MRISIKIIMAYAELAKLRITFFVAISALLGYILGEGAMSLNMLVPFFGVLFLASGAAALNQLQEEKYDSIMSRTQKRPLPTGALSKEEAMIFIIFSSIFGFFLLSLSFNIVVSGLGLLTLLWYNAVYTPLKRKTALAVLPGALTGAFPPIIGWAFAGASLASPQIWAIAFFFFIWQIPHFWFLFVIYGDDYKKAGFPSITDTFSENQIRRISFVWVASLAASCMLIPMFGISSSIASYLILFCFGALLVWRTKGLIKEMYSNNMLQIAFRDVNLYVLLVVATLSIDKII